MADKSVESIIKGKSVHTSSSNVPSMVDQYVTNTQYNELEPVMTNQIAQAHTPYFVLMSIAIFLLVKLDHKSST